MKTEPASGREEGSILWMCLIVLVIIGLGGAWYVTTQQVKRPEPQFQAAVVTAKVPSPPAVKEEPAMDTNQDVFTATDGQTGAMPLSPGFETSPSEESVLPVSDLLESSDPVASAETGDISTALADSGQPERQMAEPADEPALQASSAAGNPEPELSLREDETTDETAGMDQRPDPVAVDREKPELDSSETTTATEAAVQAGAVKKPGMTIQVAAFHTKAYAEAMRDKLNEKGYTAYIHETTGKKGIWYMVRFGHFENRRAAAEPLARFNQSQNASAVIVNAH